MNNLKKKKELLMKFLKSFLKIKEYSNKNDCSLTFLFWMWFIVKSFFELYPVFTIETLAINS